MELGLVRDIGSKALLAGGVTLLGYWIYNAVKLVLAARGINPLLKQFFHYEVCMHYRILVDNNELHNCLLDLSLIHN